MFLIALLPTVTMASFEQSKTLDEVDRRIASSTQNLQRQIDSLSYQLLQLKTASIPVQNTVIQQVVVDQETKVKVENLEVKVGTLQRAVDYLQINVINALDKIIGMLNKLIK